MDKDYQKCRLCGEYTKNPERNRICVACANMLEWSKEDLIKELSRYRSAIYKKNKPSFEHSRKK